MPLPDVHLDLGCGKRPRNPYGRQRVCGVDIRALADQLSSADFEFKGANLAVEPIPFDDNRFGSVSAFDFIEHVPRVLATPDGRDTFFPFVRLMDEIWRVLAPGGLLYALTPAWPNPDVFVDPTHVNVITERSHEYFCGASPLGRMYGFQGRFEVRRAHWTKKEDALVATPVVPPELPFLKRASHGVRDSLRRWRGRTPPPHHVIYFLWELEAVKP